MYQTFEFTQTIHGEAKTEMLILAYPPNVNIDKVLHDVGLAYCMDPAHSKTCRSGLTFKQLLGYITPEMLKPYGVRMIWPRENALQMDDAPPIVSQYELESHQEFQFNEQYRMRKMCDVAERFAKRLERQKENSHPVISTWDSASISAKAVVWAGQFIRGTEPDASKFFSKKLQGIVPCKRSSNDEKPSDGADLTEAYAGPPLSQKQSEQQTT